MKIKIVIGIPLILVSLASFECWKREKAMKVSLFSNLKKMQVFPQAEAVRIAVGARVSPRQTFTYYRQLLDYLSNKLGKPTLLIQRRTDRDINDLLKKGSVELGFISSGAYVEAHEEFGIEILAVPVVKGQRRYFSYIIVRKGSKIKKFEDLRGKSFAFANPISETGTIFPTYLVAQRGYALKEYFSKTIFTHSHDNSIMAVAEKLVDAASVDSFIWDYLSATDPRFVTQTKVILVSPPFGNPPVVVSKNVDPQLKERLRQIFLDLHKDEESKEILQKLMIDRFIRGDDSMYDSVRHMKKFVENIACRNCHGG